jgi:hypothetical protein
MSDGWFRKYPSFFDGGQSMDEASNERALTAVRIANKHLMSAWQHLAGRRLPMAGIHRDFDKALADLRLVYEKTAEAMQLIQGGTSAVE